MTMILVFPEGVIADSYNQSDLAPAQNFKCDKILPFQVGDVTGFMVDLRGSLAENITLRNRLAALLLLVLEAPESPPDGNAIWDLALKFNAYSASPIMLKYLLALPDRQLQIIEVSERTKGDSKPSVTTHPVTRPFYNGTGALSASAIIGSMDSVPALNDLILDRDFFDVVGSLDRFTKPPWRMLRAGATYIETILPTNIQADLDKETL